MTGGAWNLVASIGATGITYACARAAAAPVWRVVGPPRGEVLLVSDLILATAFGVGIYLWLNLGSTRTRLTDLERAQIGLETQLSLAVQIQGRLLPPAPVASNGLRWAGRLEPAHRIGGDFYDYIPGEAGDLLIVGDVSGKGIPAALLQASAHSLFRAFARETPYPSDLLARVSREIYAENAGASYLTCLVVRVNSVTHTLMYANAGHPTGVMVGASRRPLRSRGGPRAGPLPGTAFGARVRARS